jgi:hypothetical protein
VSKLLVSHGGQCGAGIASAWWCHCRLSLSVTDGSSERRGMSGVGQLRENVRYIVCWSWPRNGVMTRKTQ